MKNLELKQAVYPFVVGIDVSKQTLDVCQINCNTGQLDSVVFTNTAEGYIELKRWLKKLGNDHHDQTLFCMEHTGIYTRNILKYLLSRGGKVWMESSLHIKRSIGLIRGKSDKIDAQRIAHFAYTHQHEAKLVQLSYPTIDRLQYLMRTRMRILKSLSSQQRAIDEMISVDKKAGRELERLCRQSIEGMKSH